MKLRSLLCIASPLDEAKDHSFLSGTIGLNGLHSVSFCGGNEAGETTFG